MAIEGKEIVTVGNTSEPSNSLAMTSNTSYQSVRNLALIDNGTYEFMENSYFGTGGYRSGRYLVPHTAESEMSFERRQDLAYYKNYVQPIIRAMIDPVFNHEIKRNLKDTSDILKTFVENADGAGSSLQEVLDSALTYSIMHGVSFIVVDNYPDEAQPRRKVDAVVNRILPMANVRRINEVDSYQCDRNGALEWIVFYDESYKTTEGKEVKVFSGWYKGNYRRIEESVVDGKKTRATVKDVPLGINVLPVITILNAKKKNAKDLKVDPPLFDLARINHAIFNKDSLITTQERAQGFAMFYVQEEKPGNLIIGRANYLSLPMTTTMPPGVIAPPAEILTTLIASSDGLREDLFRIANQKGVDFVTKQAKSGDALEWEFQAQEATLKHTAMIAQNVEYKIVEIINLYTNSKDEYLVEYPEKFSPDNETADIEVIDKVLLMGMPTKATTVLKKRAFKIATRREEEDDVSEALDDFETMPIDEPDSKNNVNNMGFNP